MVNALMYGLQLFVCVGSFILGKLNHNPSFITYFCHLKQIVDIFQGINYSYET